MKFQLSKLSRKKVLYVLCTILVVVYVLPSLVCRFTNWQGQRVRYCGEGPETSVQKTERKLTIGSQELTVEIADTIPTITKGLGDRNTLGSDGMLFVMPIREIPTFWMKGMRFNLDFVWIDGNTVVDITENVPAEPGVYDSQLQRYSPRFPITHVLEMNAGEIEKKGIQIGDQVVL